MMCRFEEPVVVELWVPSVDDMARMTARTMLEDGTDAVILRDDNGYVEVVESTENTDEAL
jgi:hypothetical protein